MVYLDCKSLLLLLAALFVSSDATDDCHKAELGWTAQDFETCVGTIVEIIGGGNYDFSNWTQSDFDKVFATKSFRNGFTVKESTFNELEFGTTIAVGSGSIATITVVNNNDLSNMDIDIAVNDKGAPPILQIHGNRKLDFNSLDSLENVPVDPTSYIQGDNECDLDGKVVKDTDELKSCKSVYGNLVLDGNTKINATSPLEYVQGCLQISGTAMKDWTDFAFLKDTTTRGGCQTGHKLTGNKDLCLSPEETYKLQQIFPRMDVSSNQDKQQCSKSGDCSGSYFISQRDAACTTITDTLVISNLSQTDNLRFLDSVKEIRGTLKVVGTGIENLQLKNLEALNTLNITRNRVIELISNPNLKTFDLPKLTKEKMIRVDKQTTYYSDNNGGFKISNETIQRLGLESYIARNSATIPPTTTTTSTTPSPAPAANSNIGSTTAMSLTQVIETQLFLVIGLPLILAIVAVVGVFVVCLLATKKIRKSSKWQMMPVVSSEFLMRGPILDFRAHPHIAKAVKVLQQNKEKIAAQDREHMARDPSKYSGMTFLNCDAPAMMATEEQYEDYKENGRTACNSPDENLLLPVGKDGVYGQRFMDKAGRPMQVKYGTQCDYFAAEWFTLGVKPVIVDAFEATAKRMTRVPGEMIAEKLRYLWENEKEIPAFGVNFDKFSSEPGFNLKVENRAKQEPIDSFTFAAHWPEIKMFRYRASKDKLGGCEDMARFKVCFGKNILQYVSRLTRYMLALPAGQCANLSYDDVHYFLKVTHPKMLGNPMMCMKTADTQSYHGEYSVPVNKSHVRIVGELRGDFDALRKVLCIPSNIGGEEHPAMQYSWVFLGNYASGHPLSVETILTLLGLQALWGGDCITMLRGVLEFEEMNEYYGFKEMLNIRFPGKGDKLWELFNRVFATFPLNCQVLYRICCTHSGLSETDLDQQYLNAKEKEGRECALDSTAHSKVFSLPNVTVRDYYDNVDTRGGYYFGERIMHKIGMKQETFIFFMTTPMDAGLGFFGEYYRCQLFALNSVRNLRGHGGQTGRLAVVAEVNAKTERITFNVILNEDETFEPAGGKNANKVAEKVDEGKGAAKSSAAGGAGSKAETPSAAGGGAKTTKSSVSKK